MSYQIALIANSDTKNDKNEQGMMETARTVNKQTVIVQQKGKKTETKQKERKQLQEENIVFHFLSTFLRF